jgi:hypothetical protein
MAAALTIGTIRAHIITHIPESGAVLLPDAVIRLLAPVGVDCRASYSIAAAFKIQTIVAVASFADTLRIACGRSHR